MNVQKSPNLFHSSQLLCHAEAQERKTAMHGAVSAGTLLTERTFLQEEKSEFRHKCLVVGRLLLCRVGVRWVTRPRGAWAQIGRQHV